MLETNLKVFFIEKPKPRRPVVIRKPAVSDCSTPQRATGRMDSIQYPDYEFPELVECDCDECREMKLREMRETNYRTPGGEERCTCPECQAEIQQAPNPCVEKHEADDE